MTTIHFGGTQYAKYVIQSLWGLPPRLDMELEKRVQAAIRRSWGERLVESAHDLGDGGLAVALGGMRVRQQHRSARATRVVI